MRSRRRFCLHDALFVTSLEKANHVQQVFDTWPATALPCTGGHCERTGGIVAEQWTVHGAGHAWSDGGLGGSYTDACGPSASQEMLRFFMERMDG